MVQDTGWSQCVPADNELQQLIHIVQPFSGVLNMAFDNSRQSIRYFSDHIVGALFPLELVPPLNGLGTVDVVLSKIVQHMLRSNFKHVAYFEAWRAGDDQDDAL
jgi:hypothetical protein